MDQLEDMRGIMVHLYVAKSQKTRDSMNNSSTRVSTLCKIACNGDVVLF